MRIESLRIRNVASYRDETEFQLGSGLNILIGPNGGGKSNAQKILLVLLTRYFLPHYVFKLREGQDSISLAQKWDIREIRRLLDRHVDDADDQEISISLKVEESDIANMRAISANIERLRQQAAAWNHDSINSLTDNQINSIQEAGSFTYEFRNNQAVAHSDIRATHYLNYLRSFFMIARLAEKVDGMILRSPIFNFSSVRQSGSNFSTQANQLTTDQYFSQYQSAYAAATGGATNLIQFATSHFGRLMWQAIKQSSESSLKAVDIFEAEIDVKLVRRYLKKLGYDWQFDPADDEMQSFEMRFYKDGIRLMPEKFSSGEREIFHFLFAAFALNVEHGLIVVDEPELHLHPRWQRIFLDLFYDLSQTRKNQFVLATHSPSFVTPRTIGNITRIFQVNRSSNIASLTQVALPNKKDLVHIVNSHNNERLFFADEVVLVEGISDRLIFSSLVTEYCRKHAVNRTIEVVEVAGKHNFSRYANLCTAMKMPVSIVADRDYLREIGSDAVRSLFASDSAKIWSKISGKKSTDRVALYKGLESAIENNDTEQLKEFWKYLKGRGSTIRSSLSCKERKNLMREIDQLRMTGVFVLKRGEIEDYLPTGHTELSSIIDLIRDPNWLESRIDRKAARELDQIASRLVTAQSY